MTGNDDPVPPIDWDDGTCGGGNGAGGGNGGSSGGSGGDGGHGGCRGGLGGTSKMRTYVTTKVVPEEGP